MRNDTRLTESYTRGVLLGAVGTIRFQSGDVLALLCVFCRLELLGEAMRVIV
jgi:hypothetical protein